MARRIILLSGPICGGKSTLGVELSRQFPTKVTCFKTHEWISSLLGAKAERRRLQRGGEELDRRTAGQWVCDELARRVTDLPADAIVVVDSVRIKAQIDRVRMGFGANVSHIHVTAPDNELRKRFSNRRGVVQEPESYLEARANRTEKQVEALERAADLVMNTHRDRPVDVAVKVASHLGLYSSSSHRLVDVLVGGQFGSEGKGQVAAYLAPEYSVLVRVGGPNAGHSVFGNPPRKFHHLPSGTARAEEATIVLGPGAVLRVDNLLKEIRASGLTPGRCFIDPQAMTIATKDVQFEDRLRRSIGSTGQGVGAATARKVLRNAWRKPVKLAKDVSELREYIRETLDILDRAFAAGKRVFLEGTQGTALSLHHGDYPFVTSRDTTVSGCLAESGISPSRVRRTILVCRTYPIRVQNPDGGTSGAMSREISWAEVARRSGHSVRQLRKAERTTTTNRRRRVAEFDWSLYRRAISLNGPTDVALTFSDYIDITNRDARRFEQLTPETIRFIQELERVAGAPVSLIATRFHYRSVIDRRSW